MTEELKEKILDHIEWMRSKIGETILVKDWICTSGRSYDRHQTRYGKQIIKIDAYYVRMSGAIASIVNENQSIEYRTDAIKHIELNDNTWVIEINMQGNVWRQLSISVVTL